MPGGRPRVLTADQIERATLLRHVGLSIADCAAEVHANRETLREAFVRLGVQPRPQPDFSKPDFSTSRDLPSPKDDTPIDAAASVPPADISMSNAPAANLRHDGWAVDFVMQEVLARRHPSAHVQSMDEDDHRKFDSLAEDTTPYRGNW